jgi:hypothetical protein
VTCDLQLVISLFQQEKQNAGTFNSFFYIVIAKIKNKKIKNEIENKFSYN